MRKDPFYTAVSVGFLSAFVISYQISLINALDFISYSRFAQVIISLALLGFGVSGTFLSFYRIETRRNNDVFISVLFIALIAAVPLSYRLAGALRLDIQYVFFSLLQFIRFLLYIFLFFIPFFLAAVLIGSFLSIYRSSVDFLYGANLLGSGIGGILILPLFFVIFQVILPFRLTVLPFAAFIFWIAGRESFRSSGPAGKNDRSARRSRKPLLRWIIVAPAFIVCTLSMLIRPEIQIDQYKTLSYLERLERQGSAEYLYGNPGPRGMLQLYGSGTFHDALFAGPTSPAVPPEQLMLLRNGEHIGTVFRVESEDEADILDYTPQSLSYRLHSSPKVCILGETGGTNILLARRFSASAISVVQPSSNIIRVWTGILPSLGSDTFSGSDLSIVEKDPRLFLKATDKKFDIIHVAGAEGMPASRGGIYSADEDFLLTIEGIGDCYRRLSEDGCIAVTRGLQSPPRDNIKIISLYREALVREGITEPGLHIIQAKNYLAATTILFKKKIGASVLRRYKTALDMLHMDSEWHPGIDSSAIHQTNSIPGPPGKPYSYLHYGARRILSDDPDSFYSEYVYHVLPASDDAPYFNRFFRWKSLQRITENQGLNWFRNSELGYLLLFFTFCTVFLSSFLFVLVPHFISGKARIFRTESGNRGAVRYLLIYPLIGIGFMFFEMVMIHKLGIFLGTPVYSIAAVVTSILIFSGIGSIVQGRLKLPGRKKIRIAAASAVIYLSASTFIFHPLVQFVSSHGIIFRFSTAILFIAPPAFFLGWFFSGTASEMVISYPNAVPLAWGLNGFASVTAVPLTTLLAIHTGYRTVSLIAAGLYLLVALCTFFWKQQFS